MTAPHPPTSPDNPPRTTDLNLARVAAAALAAVTTAVLSSRLGAEGTLIGAAGASVVTTVATALYQISLERSGQRVRSLTHRTRSDPDSGARLTAEHPAAPDSAPGDQRITESPGRPARSAAVRWGAVAAGAVGGFMLAMLAITGFEWASGETVGGNGKGTTIGQVVTEPPAPKEPPASPATHAPATPTTENPIPTPTGTSEPPATSTTAPNGGVDVERSPTITTSEKPTPSQTPPPSLLPGLPGIGH
ncbi:MAG TPA: hypothetical protein VFO16_21740 [Pseudonocardiaceae bacterium]|nr:hypothetical protein [Pseudonocardiaceae bacterium]